MGGSSRSGWVRRASILAALRQHNDRRIVSIVAPAGFGKSTTLLQWADEIRRTGASTVLVSLTEADNHENAFLERLVEALAHGLGGRDAERALRSSPLTQPAVVVEAVLRELAAFGDDVVIFLDDYHVLEREPVRRIIEALTERSAPNVRFVIASRVKPDLRLGRLRMRGELFEIGPDDLRFGLEEAQEFFAAVSATI